MVTTKNLLRIGTRRSSLALWQAEHVRTKLLAKQPQLDIQLVHIMTSGDLNPDLAINKIGGKSVFVKEIEQALLNKDIDLAVHSMKDVPGVITSGLKLTAILRRADPSDVLVGYNNNDLPFGAIVGTGSLRRKSQLLAWRPDLKIKAIRGNVDTRIKKCQSSSYDAIVLAAAGLIRLNMNQHIASFLDFSTCLPAVAQGAIGIETRQDAPELEHLLAPLNDAVTATCVSAERAFNSTLGGNCFLPVAALGQIVNNELRFTGRIIHPEGEYILHKSMTGTGNDATTIGQQVAKHLLQNGGDKILQLCIANTEHHPSL